MKKALLIIACVALPAFADDSALVKAAKASGGPKKKSTKKVITNADVKKSAGTVTVLPASKGSVAPQPKTPAKSPLLKQEEDRRAAEASAKKIAAAEMKVKGLETELARVEQSYYESNDPNTRDTTIKQRFEETKKKLEAARKELADARPKS